MGGVFLWGSLVHRIIGWSFSIGEGDWEHQLMYCNRGSRCARIMCGSRARITLIGSKGRMPEQHKHVGSTSILPQHLHMFSAQPTLSPTKSALAPSHSG